MITALEIENLVTIQSLSISFSKNFTAITGETGSGKSVLMGAISLALGEKASAKYIHPGASCAVITLQFKLENVEQFIHKLLQEQGWEETHNLTLQRRIEQTGKNKILLNGKPLTLATLKILRQSLVDVHSQWQRFLSATEQLKIIDRFGNLEKEVEKVAGLYKDYKYLQEKVAQFSAQEQKAEEEQEYIQYALKELGTFDPKPDEEESLLSLRHQLKEATKYRGQIKTLIQRLEASKIESLCAESLRQLTPLAETFPDLGSSLPHLEQILEDYNRVLDPLNTWLFNQPSDNTQEADQVEERLMQLRSLARKHQCTPSDLPKIKEKLVKDLQHWQNLTTTLKTTQKNLEYQKQHFWQEARSLSNKRKKTAKIFQQQLQEELRLLCLPEAHFEVDFEEEARESSLGLDYITFLVSFNAGYMLQPLHLVASGGEASRFFLALKSILSRHYSIPTLIFDEIDKGVGGAVAASIGQKIANLSQTHQVIAITHAPQVAAYSDHHLSLYKHTRDKSYTQITLLSNPAERLKELARMLSGQHITDAALHAAQSLLDQSTHSHKVDS